MNDLTKNTLQVFLGFLLGILLLPLIIDLPIVWISLIQMAFYTCFYTVMDKVMEGGKD